MSRSIEVLLVEDNPSDAELTLHALRKAKFQNPIVHVKDGEEALDFVFCRGRFVERRIEDTPKVILLDLKLPKVDGLEVLRSLKEDARTCRIPVVMLTSSREEQDIVETYRLGVNSYIVKPVDFAKFGEAVERVGFYWLLLNEPPAGGPLR